jgi:hypothetical protein
MEREIATTGSEIDAKTLETVLLQGDLSGLSVSQRLTYYRRMCESAGLNPLAKPFEYLTMKGDGGKKLVLYARAEAFDQIRSAKGMSVKVLKREIDRENGVYTVVVQGKLGNVSDERIDEASASVPIMKENGSWVKNAEGKPYFKGDGTFSPMHGEDLSNAMMKCETKAKRRLTISMSGLALACVITSDTGEAPTEATKAIDDGTMVLIKQGQEFLKLAPAELGIMARKYDPDCSSLSTMGYDAGTALLNEVCDMVLTLSNGALPDGISSEFAAELAKHTREAADTNARAFVEKF